MAEWVNQQPIQSNYYSPCYYDISGGYSNVQRNGNNVSFDFGIRLRRTTGSYTYNGIKIRYPNNTSGALKNIQRGGSTSYLLEKNIWYYASDSYKNTSETLAYHYSGTVSGGNAGGSISITIGWNDTLTNPTASSRGWDSYTFSVPYPSLPSNVNLFVNREKIDGSYEGAKLWKTISVPYGGSYSQTWNETGFNSVTFANSNVVEALNHTKKATRLQYYLDLCGFLDNVNKDTLKNGVVTYGTCSLSFNDGTAQQNELTDYNKKHRYGTTYNFLNIKPSIGHTYKGVKEGSLTGQITKNTITRLNFVTNDVYANCDKDSPGDVYIKVNNKWKRASAVYYNKNGNWIKING